MERMECGICMEEIDRDAFTSGCQHVFHQGCMQAWLDTDAFFEPAEGENLLLSNPECPFCRYREGEPLEAVVVGNNGPLEAHDNNDEATAGIAGNDLAEEIWEDQLDNGGYVGIDNGVGIADMDANQAPVGEKVGDGNELLVDKNVDAENKVEEY